MLILLAVGIWVLQYQASTTTVAEAPPTIDTTKTPPTAPATTTTNPEPEPTAPQTPENPEPARVVLETIEVKGRAAKSGYTRTQFGEGWSFIGNCDTRNAILNRDLVSVTLTKTCKVQSGVLNDPYTGTVVNFVRGADTSDMIQIDHVVALSNAWQTGAQLLDEPTRIALANDPLELLAVDGNANQAKGDGDAATWLPANKVFRCQYISRQIAVKAKYKLWVTEPEKNAMLRVLESCPEQTVPTVK